MKCPTCSSPYAYQNNTLWICPECNHEWSAFDTQATHVPSDSSSLTSIIIKDAFSVELKDGDTVSLVKDLKLKGSSKTIKVGTKARNIKLILDSSDGHNISCKIDEVGHINLKSEFVKKV
jgi:protein PhnA